MQKKGNTKGNSLFSYYGFTKKDSKEYPVISRILKQLTPKRIEKEIAAIQAIELPPDFQKWVKEYEKIGDRSYYLWQWSYQTFNLLTFSCVAKKYINLAKKAKFLILMFIVLLDDAADKLKNKKLLNNLLLILLNSDYIKIKSTHTLPGDINYFRFTIKVWQNINKIIKNFPRFKEFKEILDFDFFQLINTMRFAKIINSNPFLINETEYWMYFSNNMQGMISSTIDISCSPKFNSAELGRLREITWVAQQMTRIGNWISTWKREIKDGDFTAGVFPIALEKRLLMTRELFKENEKEIIRKIDHSSIEHDLLIRWDNFYRQILLQRKNLKSLATEKFLAGLEKWIILELSSRQKK